MGTLIVVESILELITMHCLVLAVVHEGSIWANFLPLTWLDEFGILTFLAAGELDWLIVRWQHLSGLGYALVGPKSGGDVAWGGIFSALHKIFDDRGILERCSSLK